MGYSKWQHPDNETRFIKAVADSTSIAEVCRKLELVEKGGNYRTIKHHITRLKLDISHHTGQAWNRENYRVPNSTNHRTTLKAHLIREYGYKCWQCGLFEWQGRPIPLEMDHINGHNNDNRLDNLRILCCNCHALTPTFRNQKREHAPVAQLVEASDSSPDQWEFESPREYIPSNTCFCGKNIARKAKTCYACRIHPSKIDWPSKEELLDRLSKSNYTKLAKELGVSDNAIRKHLIK